MNATKELPTPPRASNNPEEIRSNGNLNLGNSITLGSGLTKPSEKTVKNRIAKSPVESPNIKNQTNTQPLPERRGPGRPRIHPIVINVERRKPGRPRLYPLTGPIPSRTAATAYHPSKNKSINPEIKAAAYLRSFPSAKAGKKRKNLSPNVMESKFINYVTRAWENVSAKKAARFFPQLNPGFLQNKFRWGAFKTFATSRGNPIQDVRYPAAVAYSMDWLVECNYAKREEGKLKLRSKGRELYNLLFKNRGPRDFA